jgi:16S rRNA (cytosine1402-N4)-methyltransferase
MDYSHQPVMVREVMNYLAPAPGSVIVDCTLGGAGHSRVIAAMIGPQGVLIGIDRDREALQAASEALSDASCRVSLVHGDYGDIESLIGSLGYPAPDGVLFDFGVSSHQLDAAERGFTYREDAPLDMRMDQEVRLTAADIVNTASVQDLETIISDYGEERWARRIARRIAQERQEAPILTTGRLVQVILASIPAGAAAHDGPHPARRTFQALRIAVNDELGSVRRGTAGAVRAAARGARIVALSYHSLEDRIVKELFRAKERPCSCPPSLPACVCGRRRALEVATRRPIRPSEDEVQVNPRARSAKLRAAIKVLGPGEDE